MEPAIVYQEVLSRSRDERKPLAQQEFYELRIEESDDIWRPGFVVKQIRAVWNEAAKIMKWEEPEFERWPTLRKAQERCEARRDALRTQGFDFSDMDLF
jgi:hypothetical protein